MLKWSDGTRLEEVAAMKVVRYAGFSVPKVISYGEHPDMPHAPTSILMTRLPGKDLEEAYEELSNEERNTIFTELETMLRIMRKWPHPWEDGRICSVMGTAIRSARVPSHLVGPCKSGSEFNDSLLLPATSDYSFLSQDLFEQQLDFAKRTQPVHHAIVFTHGDLKHHNIMVHNGHISGFIDWESAGWYPEYWEFTAALSWTKGFWWYEFVSQLGGSRYMAEMEYEDVLTSLTRGTYLW